MPSTLLSANQKALLINRNEQIYGAFSEIGAGQETARYFFRVGGASKTVARSLSAYDKTFSDSIYGKEDDGRYVTENRLKKMLNHEWKLLQERLSNQEIHQSKCFFAFANTFATTNPYKEKKEEGNGWIGIRFQCTPSAPPNDILLHIKLSETDTRQQQQTVGNIGVNLIYASYFYYHNVANFIHSIYDNLNTNKFSIDVINFSGPLFKEVDNRLISLFVVRNGYTRSVCFSPDAQNILLSDLLYKKNILLLRGNYRPVTKINLDIATKSSTLFQEKYGLASTDITTLFELTLHNLEATANLDERDFLDRAELLCSLGKYVFVTNYPSFHETILYLSKFTTGRIATGMGLPFFKDIFLPEFYTHLPGGLIEAIGVLHNLNTDIYVYPSKDKKTGIIHRVKDIFLSPSMQPIFQIIAPNITEIEDFNKDILSTRAIDIIHKIHTNDPSWETMVPKEIVTIIKEKKLFSK